MKYVTNHTTDFMAPGCAFACSLMQVIGGLAAEFCCIMYLCSINSPVDIIIRFVALASIAKVDDFYAGALPSDHILKREKTQLVIKNRRRHIQTREKGGENLGCMYKVMRFIYKSFRIYYAAFVFYFLPFAIIFFPYVNLVAKTVDLDVLDVFDGPDGQ